MALQSHCVHCRHPEHRAAFVGDFAPTSATPGEGRPGATHGRMRADGLLILRRSLTRSFGLRPQDDKLAGMTTAPSEQLRQGGHFAAMTTSLSL